MFSAQQIKKMLNAKSFRPFRIKTSDGSSYVVTHHDNVLVTRSHLEVGLDLDKNEIPGRVARCAILLIVNIACLQPA